MCVTQLMVRSGAARQRPWQCVAGRRARLPLTTGARVKPLTTQKSGPTGSSSRKSRHAVVAPKPTRPCRPRDGGRPCRVGSAASRGGGPGRARLAPRLVDVQARSPQHDDHRTQASPVAAAAAARMTATISSTSPVSRVAHALFCWRATGMEPASWPVTDVDRHDRTTAETWAPPRLVRLAKDRPRQRRSTAQRRRLGHRAASVESGTVTPQRAAVAASRSPSREATLRAGRRTCFAGAAVLIGGPARP